MLSGHMVRFLICLVLCCYCAMILLHGSKDWLVIRTVCPVSSTLPLHKYPLCQGAASFVGGAIENFFFFQSYHHHICYVVPLISLGPRYSLFYVSFLKWQNITEACTDSSNGVLKYFSIIWFTALYCFQYVTNSYYLTYWLLSSRHNSYY